MLARSCHRVSLTTRGPAFRHLRSRHPPVPVFPFRGLASARKKMDSLGGLGPSDSDFPRRLFTSAYSGLVLFFYFRGKCVDTRGSTRYQRSRRPRARVDEHAAGPRRHPALVRSESLRGLNPRFLVSLVQEPTVRARLRPELLGQPPVGRLHLFGTRKKQPQESCGTGRERAAAQRGQIEPGGGD